MRTRFAASVLSGSVLLLGLTGCSDDAEPTAAEGSPSASAGSSEAAEPSPAESAAADGGGDAASEAFLERLKAGMGDTGSVHVEMLMTGPVKTSAEGDTTYGPGGSEMQLTMQMADLPGGMEMVLVDDRAYLSVPGVTEQGKFFEIDPGNPMFAGLEDGLSPADSFAAFEAGLQKVEKVGPEPVDGEPATRYRLEVDAERALAATGQPEVPGLPETLTYDVWLDSEDRMRRLVYALAGTKLTMDMSDWGEPVTIEAPDPTDIVEAPPMAGG